MPIRGIQAVVVVATGLFATVLFAVPVDAQEQSLDQQLCIRAINKEVRKISDKQGTLQRSCVKAESVGKAGDADACIAGDDKGKVTKARMKALAIEAKKCVETPDFAYTGATVAADLAVEHRLALLHDMLDAGGGEVFVILKAEDRTLAKCQQKVVKAFDKVFTQKLKVFEKCKKSALGAVTDANGLAATCMDAVATDAADPKGKIGKAIAKLALLRSKSCESAPLDDVFPGVCASFADSDFDDCVDVLVECRACRTLDEADALGVDCDAFDDGVVNESCPGGTTPGSTVTSTTTTTSTSTSVSTTTTSTTTTTMPVVTTTTTTTTSTVTPGSSTTSSSLPADVFLIALGDSVSDGVPDVGAGRIDLAGDVDRFRFRADVGDVVFFDETKSLGVPWAAEDRDGTSLFSNNTFGGGDPGRFELTRGGWYTIEAGNLSDPTTGTYSFTLWQLPADEEFAIAIGDAVSNGVPVAGAGNLEIPGVRDIYTFDATPGEIVFFDEQGQSGLIAMAYSITDENGTVVVSNTLSGGEPGLVELTLGGTYTLEVGSDTDDGTGTYSFEIWNGPVNDAFAISIGDSVADGVPSAGAGNIETPGARDIYTFTASAGEFIFFDEQGQSGLLAVPYTITDEDAVVVVSNTLSGGEPGLVELTRGGTYTIEVGSDTHDNTGTYAFEIWAAPVDQAFPIAIGDSVSDGVPSSGAGNIETPGARDIYTFTATPGEEIFFDEQGQSGLLAVPYTITDEDDVIVVSNTLSGGEPGRVELTRGGTYTIEVGSDTHDNTGTYSFEIWAIPAGEMFSISIGDTVSDGVPASGAGNIESPGARDIYTFTATAGETVDFQELGQVGLLVMPWSCEDSTGTVVFSNTLSGSSPGEHELTLGGTYTIEVGSDTDDGMGTYSFSLTSAP